MPSNAGGKQKDYNNFSTEECKCRSISKADPICGQIQTGNVDWNSMS